MTNGDWPAPEPHEERPRLPLPRVDDLPIAEQGYDREAVQEAFDAFYRHAAQLDATLRTLEAVEVFQRTASELRAEMRTIRAGGWTVSSYGRGYGGGRGGGSGVREWSLPPAFPRIAAEALFLIVIGIVVGVAGWSRIAIVLVMGLALALVWLVELVASRERAVPRTAVAPPTPPKLDEEPAELPAGEAVAAEEGPEAMTILGAAEPARAESEDTEEEEDEEEEEAEPEPEPLLEPEEEALPVAAEVEAEPEPAAAHAEVDEEPEREPEPPPEVQVPPPSPIVAPGGAPPIPAPVPPTTDEPEPTAAEAELAAAAVDAGDEIDEAPETERAEELVAQSHKVEPAGEVVEESPLEAVEEAPEPAAEELVAQSHKVEPPLADVVAEDAVEAVDGPEDEDTLSGIPAVPAPPARRRFGLFRRRDEHAAEAEAVSAPSPEAAVDEPAVDDPWVLPSAERPDDAYAAESEPLDPWEQGPQLAAIAGAAVHDDDDQDEPERESQVEPQPLELVVEPEPESEPPLEPDVEPEPVELVVAGEGEPDGGPEPESEPEPTVSELPVEVLAEQAAASIDRSRARRRRPLRRARRR